MPRPGKKMLKQQEKSLPLADLGNEQTALEFAEEGFNGPGLPKPAWWESFLDLAGKQKDDTLSLAAAFYLSKGLTQKDIAGVLGKSESLISRAVAKARHEGWLKYDISGIPPSYAKILPAFLNDPDLAAELLAAFPGLQRCTVVPGPSFFQRVLEAADAEKGAEELATELEQLVLAAAAERLKNLLIQYPTQTLVVGWGSTINRVIRNLYALRPIPDPSASDFQGLRLYPFLGNFSLSTDVPEEVKAKLEKNTLEIAFHISVRFSANTNARMLSMILGQRIPPRPLLTVAILPVEPEQMECCQPVFMADQTLMDLYGEFWLPGNQTGAIWEADTLITSVGGANLPEAFIYRAFGPTPSKASKFIGDIGGILIDGKGREVNLEKRYLVGPRRQHVIHLAKKHRQAGEKAKGAGVFVVASGERKILPLTVLARQGFINELITDEQTARGILAGKKK